MTNIQIKVGSVADATEQMIIQGCNAQGVMGSGVARVLKTKWPKNYARYRSVYDQRKLGMGEVVWYDAGETIVGNAITQEFYGRDDEKYVSYDAVDCALVIVHRYALERGIDAVAMPAIGAGLGGGDWSVIKAIIESRFISVNPILYVLEDEMEMYT